MSYDHQKMQLFELVDPAANDLTTTGVKARMLPGLQPVIIRKIAAYIQEVGATTDPIVTVKKRVTPLTDTGAVTLGTLTWPVATPIGTVVYKAINPPVKLSPGEELVFDVTTATATSGEAFFMAEGDPSWESPAVNSDMLESA